jgi:hypothetical protein
MLRSKERALRLELAEALTQIGTLKTRNRNGARAGSARHRNLFGFGGSKQRAFYVDFEDANGNVRNLVIEAPNETAALKEGKRRMREDGENLKGATWDVVSAENLTHLVIERKEKQ